MSRGHTLTPIELVRWNLRTCGVSLDEICSAAGLSLAGRTGVTYDEAMRLWDAAERITGDPRVGHESGTRVRVHEAGIVGSLVAYAADVRTALDHLQRVMPIALPGTFTLRDEPEGVAIRYERPASDTRSRHGVESLFAGLLALLRQSASRAFPVARVELPDAPPRSAEPYERYYAAEVRWHRAPAVLAFDHASLALPMTGADEALSSHVLAGAEQVLAGARTSEVDRLVTRALRDALRRGLAPTIEATARELGVSPRSLQRQLTSAQLTFRELKQRVLEKHAAELLVDPRRSVDEVGVLLGYRTRAGFDRAFLAWTGQTPAEFRKRRGDL